VGCLLAGTVKVIVEVRGFVESEIGGQGLPLDKPGDVILDKVGLGGADVRP
jgi:hypothetical protein